MLHFILGRVSSGKTTYLHKTLGELIADGEKSAVLIVPEQFTFETDKGILDALGPVRSNRIDVYNFTRLAETVFDFYGKQHNETLSDQGRILYMSMALNAIRDKIEVYKRHIDKPDFIRNMLIVVDEFKQASCSAEEISQVLDAMDEGIFKRKMQELLLITRTYDAVVGESHSDEGDILDYLCELLDSKDYFKNKIVAVDGFNSFNGQILKVLERIILQAEDVYITLCADGVEYKEGDNDVFAFTRRTAGKLRQLAVKNCVSVAKPVVVSSELTGYDRYTHPGIKALDENLYRPDSEEYRGNTDFLGIYCAVNPEDECAYAARKIRQLLREGYRCRDIAVIYLDSEKYADELKYAFRKYGIPVFDDARQPIRNQPLVLYVCNILEIASEGFNTENMLRLMKTGLTGLSTDDISLIENYVYMWGIDGSKWKKEWTGSPNAFGEAKAKDAELLNRINGIREKLTTPLTEFAKETKGKTAKEISALIYRLIIDSEVDKHLRELAISLDEDGEHVLALEQQQIWDMLMEILNEIGVSLENTYPGIERYADFFNLSLSVKTLGRIPTGIDEVIVGSADKIRARNIRAVFVLGLNAGVFPAGVSGSGVITERDRARLLARGIELYDINKYKATEERFIAYNAVCCAKEKIYLSYCLMGGGDNKLLPGEIIQWVKRILPDCTETVKEDIPQEDYIEGEKAAFELLASGLREGGAIAGSLFEYFVSREDYRGRTEALRSSGVKKNFEFRSKEVATELFGKNMYMSASKIDVYEKCPFQYYCNYGVKAYPRKKAELDPAQSGTVVHFVLQKLVEKYSKTHMKRVSSETLEKDINAELFAYARDNMGGIDDKDSRLVYHFRRFAKTLAVIMERIFFEFEKSSFVPCDFELSIGKSDSKIDAYRLSLENGGTVRIMGDVDRVDKMTTPSGTFIRVVDYKTGVKELKLNEVLHGLNLQMLIYLMAIWKNGETHYGDKIIPAGVLYLPARFSKRKAERGTDEEMISAGIIKDGAMNGLILDDPRVITGMEADGGALLIPAGIDKKTGKTKGSVISLEQLRNLNKRIDTIISDMAQSLQNGKIPALPAGEYGHSSVCEYCNYKSVCCREDGDAVRRIMSIDNSTCLEMLGGGEDGEQEMD